MNITNMSGGDGERLVQIGISEYTTRFLKLYPIVLNVLHISSCYLKYTYLGIEILKGRSYIYIIIHHIYLVKLILRKCLTIPFYLPV